MKAILTIIILIISIPVFSQVCDVPKMNRYSIGHNNYWEDTITANQIEYWDNGNIKVEYVDLPSNKKLKKAYFKEGRLKLTVEVIQSYETDGSMEYNPKSGEDTIIYQSGICDTPDGKYIEYNEPYYSKNDIINTQGQYLNGRKYGKWQTEVSYNGLREIVIANFNSDGRLDGEYIRYYYNYDDKKAQVKWKGQFGVIKINVVIRDDVTRKLINKLQTRSERVGVWVLFDRGGNVLGEVEYKWNVE